MLNEIILYNEAHFGDVFFCLEIVKNIVKCNPNFKIYIMNKENYYYIYKNIVNLNLLNSKKYDKFDISWEINNNKLFINLWCNGGGIISKGINPESQQDRIIKIINSINLETKLKINYLKLNKFDLVPKLELSTIPKSINNRLTNFNNLIFYYNVKPRSGQYGKRIPNHENIIDKLCTKLNNYLIIVPRHTENVYQNLICLDRDGINEKKNGESLVQYAQVASKCKHIILYHCGGSYPSLTFNNNNIFYIVLNNKHISFFDIINSKKKINHKIFKVLNKNLIRINM